MKRTIRQAVLIETEQISILLDRTKRDFQVCQKCEKGTLMLPPEKIAEVTSFQIREIYRLVESEKVHFVENEKVFVCLESLLNQEN